MKRKRGPPPAAGPAGRGGTRVFRARTMDEALASVRLTLGPGAVIVATRRRRKYRLWGPMWAEIITGAAPDEPERRPAAVAGPRRPPKTGGGELPKAGTGGTSKARAGGIQASLQELLVTAGVCPGLATVLSVNALIGETGPLLSARQLTSRLGEALAEVIGTVRPVDLTGGGDRVIAFIGPHGGGKTTALAKLACELVLAGGRKLTMLTGDTHRLGAADQLARYAAILDANFGAAYTPGELRRMRDEAVVRTDVTLIDTPGRNWRSAADLNELAALLDAARPDEVHLVLPAVYQQSLAEHLISAYRPLGVDRLLVSRLDEAETYGPVINLVACCRLPLSYVGLGSDVPGTLWSPDAGHLARTLLAGRSPRDPVWAEKREEAGSIAHGPA